MRGLYSANNRATCCQVLYLQGEQMYSNPTIIWIARGGHSQHLNAALCAKEESPTTVEIHGETPVRAGTSQLCPLKTAFIQNCCKHKHRLGIKSWLFQGIKYTRRTAFEQELYNCKNPTTQESARPSILYISLNCEKPQRRL